MLDAVQFEGLGLPAAAILTEPFRTTGLVMAELQGFVGYPFVTVPHPVASLSVERVTGVADAVTPDVGRLLLDGSTNAGSTDSAEGAGAERSGLDDVVEVLAEGLRADGADLTAERSGSWITFRLHISGEACAECVMPSSVLVPILQRRVDDRLGPGLTAVLDDPRDRGA